MFLPIPAHATNQCWWGPEFPMGLNDYQKVGRQMPLMSLKVNLNSGSLEELLTIPAMTEDWALKIMRIRPMHSLEDLKKIKEKPSNVVLRFMELLEGVVEL
jgi:DNA uptake protein ComE-like DNA-binding protein